MIDTLAQGTAPAAGETQAGDGVLLIRSGVTDARAINELLRSRRLPARELVLDMSDARQRHEFDRLCQQTGWQTLPQVFVNGEFVGGEQELREYLERHRGGPGRGTGAGQRTLWTLNVLGYLSAVPFLVVAVLLLSLAGPASAMLEQLLIGYGAVILSFLGAVHWGRILDADADQRVSLLTGLLTVMPALFAWGTLLLPAAVSLPAQAVLFVGIYAVDRVALAHLPLGGWYVNLRNRLTAMVVLALLLAWYAVLR